MTGHDPIFDQKIFTDQIQTYRKNGENAIRTAGIEVDEILAKAVVSPNMDHRNGVSIIAKPSPEVVDEIRRIQDHFQELEPHQYYYPSQDLHTTIFEVVYGKTSVEVNRIVEKVIADLHTILQDLPSPVLEMAGLGIDPKGCAINFVPRNEHLQTLRTQLQERLAEFGVQHQSRYLPTGAHASFFRYIQPLQTERSHWADYLMNTPVDPRMTWKICSLYMTWGANWYGNWSRIHSMGPFRLELA